MGKVSGFVHRIFYTYFRSLKISYTEITNLNMTLNGTPEWTQSFIDSCTAFFISLLQKNAKVKLLVQRVIANLLRNKANKGISQLSRYFTPLPFEMNEKEIPPQGLE
jgi:hypothetical protein